MASLLPATVVIMTAVLLVMDALSVVISTFLPSFFCSMPKSSMKAPRVPLPSSRDTTTILLPAAFLSSAFLSEPQPSAPKATIAAKPKHANLFTFISYFPPSTIFVVSEDSITSYC